MRTKLIHGAILDTASRKEVEELLKQYTTRQDTRERVRASAVITLDANGVGQDEVYGPPPGWELEIRRVQVDLQSVNETNFPAGSIPLSTAGVSLQYLRSGTRIQWGNPESGAGAGGRVPGLETWGAEQGPYLRNGEVFEVRAVLGAPVANQVLSIYMEGILTKSGSTK